MRNRDFRIANIIRKDISLYLPVFETEKGVGSFYRQAAELSYKYNETMKSKGASFSYLSSGGLNATAVLHLVYQIILTTLIEDDSRSDFFARRALAIENNQELKDAMEFFISEFPSKLEQEDDPSPAYSRYENLRAYFIYQVMIANPALLDAAKPLIKPDALATPKSFRALSSVLSSYVKDDLRNGEPNLDDIFTFMTLPSRLFPDSLLDQIKYILREWAEYLPQEFETLLESSMDFIREETKDRGFSGGAPAPMPVIEFSDELNEYEAFSSDSNWMPRVVMIAKSTLVWLDQLTKQYGTPITTLDQIPDQELDLLAERGFTALWLIGLWERSEASKKIKHLSGNPDAVASAYSLKDYDISHSIGGWAAVENLRERCARRGIRLASDMVPNHTGIDGNWVYEHPDYFISQDYSPFPSYSYTGPDLSSNPDWEVKLEDHYYDRTDAAVTFRMVNRHTGETRYVFHGNDGTTMPWNDTAQLDYLNPTTREAVIQKIIHVAKNFPIIRFDAAMTLAKRHIERLWYPKPGTGGDIAGRAEHAMSVQEFNQRIPEEFWREVVDRIAAEVPDTLLLAEAFWMMEGYFVRTLGMHRVYNSAFMNMLKNQENQKYRQSIKNTLEFEPEILKRYVNFMNNPDEDTAIAQFGDGDRYFAIATLLSTIPGLPMIGHGQIEGYREKYGMEYQRAYYDETPNQHLVSEHYRRIFPLLRKRYLFSGVENFNFYDCFNNGVVEESVYAFTNGTDKEKTLVLVNNRYERCSGFINTSCPKLSKEGDERSQSTVSIAEALNLTFSSKSYVLLDDFADGLTYIYPSISFFDSGFEINLNGYEARVFWNIREVEDTDGCYGKMFSEFKGRGIKNIQSAIKLMRLNPFFKMLSELRSKETISIIEDIVEGKSKKKDERVLLLNLAEAYSTLYESFDSLDETAKGIFPSAPIDVDPKPVVKALMRVVKAFSKSGDSIFSAWASADRTLPLTLAATLPLIPFSKGKDIRSMMECADNLLIDYFLEEYLDELALSDSDRKVLLHEAALLVASVKLFLEMKEGDDIRYLSAVLNDSGAMRLTMCNEYNGDVWYNKERMQKTILLTVLAIAVAKDMKTGDADVLSKRLLDKELSSGYKLGALLARD